MIEREKLVVEADSDSDIQSTKAMEVCERVNFPIFEFLREFSERKMENDYSVRKRTKMCVYTSLSISRDENILGLREKNIIYIFEASSRCAGEQKLPAFI